MTILFTICGRAGSKGVKNKNLRSLMEVPLLYFSLGVIGQYQQRHPQHTVRVAMSSDSPELIALAQGQRLIQVETVRRNGALAGDLAPKVAVIADCMRQVKAIRNETYDMVVDLDLTSPLRTVEDLENAVNTKCAHRETDCVFSVTTARRNPYFNMVKMIDGVTSPVIESAYTTRQEAPSVYDMNASIYAYSPTALEQKEAVGFFHTNCTAFVMKDTAVLDIDSEEDLELMEVLMRYFVERYPEFSNTYQSAVRLFDSIKEGKKV